MARVWLSAAAYYAGLDAQHFQIPPADGVDESFEAGLGTGGEDELMLVADLDGRVAGWLTARLEHPAPGAVRQLVREPGWTPTLTAPSRCRSTSGTWGTGGARSSSRSRSSGRRRE